MHIKGLLSQVLSTETVSMRNWGTTAQCILCQSCTVCTDLSCTSVNTSNTFREFPVRSFEPWAFGRDCIRLYCWWLPLVVIDWKAPRMNECKINMFWKDEFPWLRNRKHFWLWKWLFILILNVILNSIVSEE